MCTQPDYAWKRALWKVTQGTTCIGPDTSDQDSRPILNACPKTLFLDSPQLLESPMLIFATNRPVITSNPARKISDERVGRK
jgi:hypothetical protein